MSISLQVNRTFQVIGSNVKKGLNKLGQLAGRSVQVIKNIPSYFQKVPPYLQNHHAVAYSVVAVANVAFIVIGNVLSIAIENQAEEDVRPMTNTQKTGLKLATYVLTGSISLAGNIALKQLTGFPVSKLAIAGLVAIAVASRALFSYRNDEILEDNKNEVKKTKNTTSEATDSDSEDEVKKTKNTTSEETDSDSEDEVKKTEKTPSKKLESGSKEEEIKKGSIKESPLDNVRDEHKAEIAKEQEALNQIEKEKEIINIEANIKERASQEEKENIEDVNKTFKDTTQVPTQVVEITN